MSRASRCGRAPSGSTQWRPARTGSPSRPELARRARSSARFPDDAPPLYGDGHASERHRSRSVRLSAVPEPTLYDVAVIGAGYVGAAARGHVRGGGQARARHRRAAADRRGAERAARATSRTSPPSASRRSSSRAAIVASTDYEQVKQAHAVLIALPTPLSRQREPDLSYIERAARQPRAGAAARPGRRARVDHLARHDARDPPADPRAWVGPEGRRRLPPRHVAGARRPGP